MATSKNNIAASLTVPADRDILVCIFQRGAADGLNALVPFADPDYIGHRPNIFVPEASLTKLDTEVILVRKYTGLVLVLIIFREEKQ